MYNYPSRHIYKLKQSIIRHNLSAPAGFFGASIKKLRGFYNGIGPDAWSKPFRRLVTALLEYFEQECLIHDWEFACQPRTYWHFTIANFRLIVNTFLYACAMIPVPSPNPTAPREYRQAKRARRRMILRQTARALVLALLCQFFGWRGYKRTQLANNPTTNKKESKNA